MSTHLPGLPLRERSVFIDDAARLLGVSRRTVYYRIREGRLRTIRTAGGSQRVLLSSVESLLGEEREAAVQGVAVQGAADGALS